MSLEAYCLDRRSREKKLMCAAANMCIDIERARESRRENRMKQTNGNTNEIYVYAYKNKKNAEQRNNTNQKKK